MPDVSALFCVGLNAIKAGKDTDRGPGRQAMVDSVCNAFKSGIREAVLIDLTNVKTRCIVHA
jgi:hypothetical protein